MESGQFISVSATIYKDKLVGITALAAVVIP